MPCCRLKLISSLTILLLGAGVLSASELKFPSNGLSVVDQITQDDEALGDTVQPYATTDDPANTPSSDGLPCIGAPLRKADKGVELRDDGAYLRLGSAGPCPPQPED